MRQDPAKWDESVPAMLEASEAIRQRPGCQSLVLAGDRATGEALAHSTWDTQEHARFEPPQSEKLRALGVQLDEPLVFEVLG
jgi:hypothetical protein